MPYKWKDLFGDEENNALWNAIHKAAFTSAAAKGIDPIASQQAELAAVCAVADIMHHECFMEEGYLCLPNSESSMGHETIRAATGLDQSAVDILKVLKNASIETLQKAKIRL